MSSFIDKIWKFIISNNHSISKVSIDLTCWHLHGEMWIITWKYFIGMPYSISYYYAEMWIFLLLVFVLEMWITVLLLCRLIFLLNFGDFRSKLSFIFYFFSSENLKQIFRCNIFLIIRSFTFWAKWRNYPKIPWRWPQLHP